MTFQGYKVYHNLSIWVKMHHKGRFLVLLNLGVNSIAQFSYSKQLIINIYKEISLRLKTGHL